MGRGSYNITSVDEAIDALGTPLIIELTGRSPQAISNWRAQRRIASDLFFMMASEFARRGLSADPAIWGQRVSDVERAA